MSLIADEAGQRTNQISMEISRYGVRVLLNLGSHATKAGLKTGLATVAKAAAKIPGLPGAPEHGKMSVKQLQRQGQDGLHAVELSKELLSGIKHDLAKRGVDFAVEKAVDGKTYVHIKSKDVDTLNHALSQVNAKLAKPSTRRELVEKIKTGVRKKLKAKKAGEDTTQTIGKAVKAPMKKGAR